MTLTPSSVDIKLQVRVAHNEDVYLVALSGEMDISHERALSDELRRAEASDAQSIVVDLSGLRFMDSTGLKILLAAQNRSDADGDRLYLRRGSAEVHHLFDVSGTVERFHFLT